MTKQVARKHYAKFTPKKREKFLQLLEVTGNPSQAAQAVGISRRTAYKHREKDEAFAMAWDDTIQRFADDLEQECFRRAFEGVEEPVFYEGKVCGYRKQFSDTLAIFLLKAYRPEKYRENYHIQHTGEMPIVHVVLGGQAPSEDDHPVHQVNLISEQKSLFHKQTENGQK